MTEFDRHLDSMVRASLDQRVTVLPPELTLAQRVTVLTIAATATDPQVKRIALGMLEAPAQVLLKAEDRAWDRAAEGEIEEKDLPF